MTRAFVIKHLRTEANGTRKYRRRVPKGLQSALGKTEFVKVLGKTEQEALRNYGPYHDHVERLLRSATPKQNAADLVRIKADIEAHFYELELTPYSPGDTPDERLSRSEEAERILGKYPTNPATGYPDPEDVSLQDRAMISALHSGVHSLEAELSISQAFAFYLSERREPDPYKLKKQEQRFDRIMAELLKVTGQDITISKVGRNHARALRDNLLNRMTPASAKRYINDVKAVFSLAIREHDMDANNPFQRLNFPKDTDAAVDRRHPLPSKVILAMYSELENNQVLQDIWTLIHHSGCQSAEVLGLTANDLNLDGAIPFFEIKPHGLRTVKDRSRIRKVPLVGKALQVAQRLESATGPHSALFPKYVATKSHENFSNTVRARLRKHTKNPKHVVYSLRHNMKDALRAARVGERVELALLGHSSERSSSEGYGSPVRLEELHEALLKIAFDVPKEPV
ncbi:site-specific integrase [Heliomarina baculiformis]|uniref:site-specific integrase n=1 Tax=Heliomarina baculiformis TaxID=2872036 RepID=UPI001EE2A4C7|nr:site-specific integrase [Heliomarina baculiformis]